MARHQNASAKAGMSHNDYIINKILKPVRYEFKKVDGVWYKREKDTKKRWKKVVW